MTALETKFAKAFAHWGLVLPPEHVAERKRGKLVEAGWTIWYLFGRNDGGEYLDYYASHRMTDDTHERIYADGSTESLESIVGMRLCSSDPAEDKKLAEAYYANNARIGRMLTEKGFGLAGDETLSAQLVRDLRTREQE